MEKSVCKRDRKDRRVDDETKKREIEKINTNNWVEIEGKFDIEKLNNLFGNHFSNRKVKYDAKLVKIWNTNNEQIANIVRSLVELDFPIFRVEHKKENLEDIFLELTKEL